MTDISEIFGVEIGTPVLLHQKVGTLEVAGFIEKYDHKRERVRIAMSKNENSRRATEFPDAGTLERWVGRFLDMINPYLLHGPAKWHRLSDFNEYTILEPSKQVGTQMNGLVVIPAKENSYGAKSFVCGYLRAISGSAIVLSMANPENRYLDGGLAKWMRIGNGSDSENKYNQTKSYSTNDVDTLKARVLAKSAE